MSIELRPEDISIEEFGGRNGHVHIPHDRIRIRHIPTGLSAESDVGRSQHANKAQAMERLKALLAEPPLDQLKANMLAAIRAAEKAAHAYACECEVGLERERAFDIYERIRTSTRFF